MVSYCCHDHELKEPSMNNTPGREWISARIPRNVANTLNAAAQLTGTTLNNFVVQAALEKAQGIVDRESVILLSRSDAAMLLDLLDAPPPPNDAMIRGFGRVMSQKYGNSDAEDH